MRCPKCDFEISKKENFCPYCGHDLNDNKTKEEKDINQTFTSTYTEDGYETEDIEKNKIIALFSYLSFLFIIPLIVAPNSKYARFHINQGIILCITNVICGVISGFLEFIPGLENIYDLTGTALDILMTCLCVYGIYNAVNGKVKKLPVIGNFNILK